MLTVGGGTMLRDASELLYPAVYATVMTLDIDREGKDAAMAKAALRIARVIDETPDVKQLAAYRDLMPELRGILESLGASPAARAAISRSAKGSAPAQESQLDRLRAARAKRA
jgi:hypothetical protein